MKDILLRIPVFALMVLMALQTSAQVIPQPVELTPAAGTFTLSSETRVLCNLKSVERNRMMSYLRELPWKMRCGKAGLKMESVVELRKSRLPFSSNNEAYSLTVSPHKALIKANTDAGLFYGLQTLLQMGTEDGYTLKVACARVNDYPRFSYRGWMLDISRHFFNRDFIKKQIRALARYKINTLHLHITDNGGWRLEIKKYPKLTQRAAYRATEDWMAFCNPQGFDYCTRDTPNSYGGYLTQADARDIVEYAALHHMQVVPELDIPGHNNELFAAYPDLACPGKTPRTSGELCIGNEKVFSFYQDVLTEVMRIFPSRYIHLGGDEANRSNWQQCPLCLKRMKEEHIDNVAELQNYFMLRMERFLRQHGRSMIGWDEILDGDISKSAVIMSWRGAGEATAKAKTRGNKVLMTPTSNCYLDYYQDDPQTQPKAIGGYLPLKKVYDYDPNPDNSSLVMGTQGNLWTEFVATESHAEYMTYPRILAIAENGWTPQARKDYPDFHRRVLRACAYLKSHGYNTFDLTTEKGKQE